MGRLLNVDAIIEDLIDREGGFVSNPADRGGPTCFGITEAVARAHGYAGPMRQLPREEAARIYKRLYWLRPDFDQVASRNNGLAKELFGTGVNMGPAVAITFLQRALTALNRNARDYADLTPAASERRRSLRSTPSWRCAAQAGKRSCSGRSKLSRVNATSALPNVGRPTRPSSMAG